MQNERLKPFFVPFFISLRAEFIYCWDPSCTWDNSNGAGTRSRRQHSTESRSKSITHRSWIYFIHFDGSFAIATATVVPLPTETRSVMFHFAPNHSSFCWIHTRDFPLFCVFFSSSLSSRTRDRLNCCTMYFGWVSSVTGRQSHGSPMTESRVEQLNVLSWVLCFFFCLCVLS